MNRSEEAYKLFIDDKFHCSQAVVAVFPEYIDKFLALKISSCFGGGMRKGEVCGAVTGALMVLGIAFGYSDKNDLEHKTLSNKIASDFMDLFKSKFNSYLCRDIIKDRPTCGMYVKFAVEAVEEIINRG
ncbi:MAG: C-GCAxxG-C-C family protein [bacterium]|nr:C-GCAxxG-C-C family protein [bacterium]